MNAGTPGALYEYGGYTAAQDEDTEHLRFEVATDGRLKINGTGAFWSCFCIEVPSVQNQYEAVDCKYRVAPVSGTEPKLPQRLLKSR